jgi:transposase
MVCRRIDRSSRSVCRRRWKKGDPKEPEDHALGRSRGGFSTKIHLIGDAVGVPIHFELSPGQAHENMSLEDLLNGIDQELATGAGELVPWPEAIAGDKGYRAEWIDQMLLNMGVTPVIPSKKNENHEARQVDFDKKRYRDRNIIERLIGWLKECRAVFARFEKTAINYAGMIKVAFIQRYLKLLA